MMQINHRIWGRCALVLAYILLLGLTMPSVAKAQDPCTGLVITRLRNGLTARVAFNDGVGVVLRDVPGKNESGSTILQNLPEGVIFTALGDAPICKDGFLWWLARLPNGDEGFIAEGAEASLGYFVEPWEVGLDLLLTDLTNPYQLNHFFIDTRGTVQPRSPLTLTPQSGTIGTLWQEPEIALLEGVMQDRAANCPEQTGILGTLRTVRDYTFDDTVVNGLKVLQHYPARDGTQALVTRDYLVGVNSCAGVAEQYGTTVVSLVTSAGEQVLFPFSQHSDPPTSAHCQPQNGQHLDHPTYLQEVVWSQDSRYVALNVRYLRNSEAFPCAFYHIFIVDTRTATITYAGEGQRLGWGQGGQRLRYLRHERANPNETGTEKMLSVLADGTDTIEIFLPGGATWLPGALDLTSATLPWTENGDKVLACNGRVYNCGETLTFRIIDSGFEALPFIVPDTTQLGSTLASVHYVAGDTQLLWLGTDGKLFLQPISGNNGGVWREAALELKNDSPIIKVIPLQAGVGAVLQLTDGRYFYLDVLTNTVKALQGLP